MDIKALVLFLGALGVACGSTSSEERTTAQSNLEGDEGRGEPAPIGPSNDEIKAAILGQTKCMMTCSAGGALADAAAALHNGQLACFDGPSCATLSSDACGQCIGQAGAAVTAACDADASLCDALGACMRTTCPEYAY